MRGPLCDDGGVGVFSFKERERECKHWTAPKARTHAVYYFLFFFFLAAARHDRGKNIYI